LTRVALVSDVHGNLPALKAVLPVIEEADEVVCAGDLVGYYPFPNEVVEAARDGSWGWVRGNHEAALETGATGCNSRAAEALNWTREALEPVAEEWLLSLPWERSLEIGGVDVHVVHGAPGDPHRYVWEGTTEIEIRGMLERTGSDVLVLGHTHVPMEVRVGAGVIVNPGSVGQPRDRDPRASVALLDISSGEVVVEFMRRSYPVEDLKEEVVEACLPVSLWERLREGR